MNTLYILIGLLFVCILFIPNKKKFNNYENFDDPNKFNFKNSLKKIPSLLPHLII